MFVELILKKEKMKHLIIYSHLNSASFTKAVVDKVVEKSEAKGDETKIIDLYGESFQAILGMSDIESMFMGKETPIDVKKYQDMITWAEHITVVYPMWWGQMPAILKGFFDRVFANGFAYNYGVQGPEGLLGGRTAHLYILTGTPNEYYKENGMHDAQEHVISKGVFGFCNIDAKITFFGNIAMGDDALRKSYLERI
jgi:NAD(P)H dehydrogenase (quinone)